MGAVNGTLETQNLIANGKKVCSVCKEWKPLGRYSADKRRSSGYQARCLDCQGKYQKKYKAEHPDRIKASKDLDYARHKDRILAYQKKYVEENSEKVAEWRKVYAQRPEVKEKHRIHSNKYREANIELTNARIRDWKSRNQEKLLDYTHKRRAVIWGVDAEKIDVLEVADRDDWICGICCLPIDPSLVYPDRNYRSLDHILPLSLGGSHTNGNIRITHLHCNVLRGAARDS